MTAQKKQFGNLGLAPVVVGLIVSLISTGISMGLSYYAATKQAKEQADLQRNLLESEINDIAYSLHQSFPNIAWYEWKETVRLTFTLGSPTLPTPPEPEKSNYLIYIAFILVAVLATRKA